MLCGGEVVVLSFGRGVLTPDTAPDKIVTMHDQIIDKAWADVQPHDFIRWATPRFVKYGRVLEHNGHSLKVQFVEDAQPRAIPDAKWYYGQFKLLGPDAEEHLCVIDYSAWYTGPPPEPFVPRGQDDDTELTVNAAIEIVRMDAKQFRRLIRRGTIPAYKDRNDQWRIDRDLLMTLAARHGWL